MRKCLGMPVPQQETSDFIGIMFRDMTKARRTERRVPATAAKAESRVMLQEKTIAGWRFALASGNVWVVVALIAINLLAYAPVWGYGFVNYDDPQYITENPGVTAGLTWRAVLWAFTTGHEANWHPVTWLSHMLDVQLYGLNAGAHHLTNLLLHIANTLLLFWLFSQTTGAPAPSAL